MDSPGSLGALEALRRENDQLRTALVTRIVIEQAKGVLAERLYVEIDVAFERMRREARSRRMKLQALAAAIVACEPWTKTAFRRAPEATLVERDGPESCRDAPGADPAVCGA